MGVFFFIVMVNIVIYTDKLPVGTAGCANGPVIRIRPKYKDDVGLHKHEELHTIQWWLGVLIGCLIGAAMALVPALAPWAEYWHFAPVIGAGLHPLAYRFVWQYRLWSEVQCYRLQAGYYPDDRRLLFAHYVHTSYSLGDKVTERQIYEMLKV